MPLKLPRLQMNNYNIERISLIKFLEVLLDENILWEDRIKYTENKISKSIGILYKARDYLSKESLLSLYYAFIHTYINYANLKKIHNHQKHVIGIIFCKDKFSHTKELFVQNKVFNVYQLNTLNNLIFVHKIKTETAPAISFPKFQKPPHSYPNNLSKLNYLKQTSQLSRSNYRISVRGPALWNEVLRDSEKEIKNLVLFKSKIISKLLSYENEVIFF